MNIEYRRAPTTIGKQWLKVDYAYSGPPNCRQNRFWFYRVHNKFQAFVQFAWNCISKVMPWYGRTIASMPFIKIVLPIGCGRQRIVPMYHVLHAASLFGNAKQTYYYY